jgi:PleD family two-component response regulator
LPPAQSSTAGVVTVSCGGVVARAPESCEPATLLAQADALLYQAKQQGRNRVMVGEATKGM